MHSPNPPGQQYIRGKKKKKKAKALRLTDLIGETHRLNLLISIPYKLNTQLQIGEEIRKAKLNLTFFLIKTAHSLSKTIPATL